MAEDRADEIIRHFDVVAERLDGQIRRVAEGVVVLSEKLDRTTANRRHEIGEVKSMIKLSSIELDRRLSTLEHPVEDLTLRVGHLEAHRSSQWPALPGFVSNGWRHAPDSSGLANRAAANVVTAGFSTRGGRWVGSCRGLLPAVLI